MKFVSLARVIYTTAIGFLFAHVAPSAAQSETEYKLKAAFVYNFVLFTQWPIDRLAEGETLSICAHPNSGWWVALADWNDRTVKGRKTIVRQWLELDTLRGCHVLVLTSSDRERWGQIKHQLADVSTLTISDDEEINRNGVIIALYGNREYMSFDIDRNAARQAKLVLSSKLLRLARRVERYYE